MRFSWPSRLLCAGVFGFLALFLIYPVAYILQGSLWVNEGGERKFTLLFYQFFLQSPVMWRCVGHSLMLAGMTTLGCILVALPLAHLFVRYEFRFKSLGHSLLMAPLILPPFVGAIGIQQFFARFGPLNHFLGWVGEGMVNPTPFDWMGRGGFFGVWLLQVLHLFPILFLNISSALANIPPSMADTARSLGARPARIFWTVILPLLAPGIFAGSVVVFVWAFTDLGTPLVCGLYQVVAVQIFDKVMESGFNPFGYVLVVVVLGITLGGFWISRRLLAGREYVTPSRAEAGPVVSALCGWRLAGVWMILGALISCVVIPHVSMVLQSVSGKWFMTALPQEWTGRHYAELFLMPQIATSLRNSLVYATLSSLLDIGLGILIGYWMARKEFFGKTALDMLTVLPLALPGVVLAFGYVVAFNVPATWRGLELGWLKSLVNPRDNPMFLIIVSYSVRRLPYMVRAVHAGYQQVSVSLEEASQNLGASAATTFRRIVMPLLRSHLVAGGVLTFAFAFLEVSDSLILAMREPHYPVTKMIWALLGRIEPGSAGLACALGVLGMGLLWGSFHIAQRVLGKKMGGLFG